MATYVGFGRSNYVRIKDKEAFEKFIDEYGPELTIYWGNEDENSLCLIHDGEGGNLPDRREYEDENEDWQEEDINFLAMLSEHLVDEPDNIFVWNSVGYEKMRYLVGYAEAVNPKGEEVWINIDQISELCKEKLGTSPATRPVF